MTDDLRLNGFDPQRPVANPTSPAEVIEYVIRHENLTDEWLAMTVKGYEAGTEVQESLRVIAEWLRDNQEASDALWEAITSEPKTGLKR